MSNLEREEDKPVVEGWDVGECVAERHALERFEDEVIDRLFVLNAQRARVEREGRDGPSIEDVLRGLEGP